jgi:hypothetical protein
MDRDLKTALKKLIQASDLTWDETKLILANFTQLHKELNELVITSGQYRKGELARMLGSLDFLLHTHSEEISALAQAMQVRAWQRGTDAYDDVMKAAEIRFFKGLGGMENEMIRQFVTTDRIKGVTEEMRALIREEIVSGVMMEQTPHQVMAKITNIVGIRNERGYREIGTTGISAKAERIMRTELLTIQNAGAYTNKVETLNQFPDLQDMWLATGDARTRLSHLAAHGQKKPVDGYFTVGGWQCRFPGDPTLPAHERINCRCTSVPYREDWGPVEDLTGPLDELIDAEREQRAGE